jgi:2-(1,2-epoxy-1,2-dihydrophenyl)acetyl-CoA isomerase
MEFECLRYEVRGRVAVITYDRQARRNAWNVPMYREIVAAVEQANAAPEVGAIVLTAEGPVFCAGADYRSPPEPKDPVTGRSPTMATLAMAPDDSWLHLMRRSKPVVVAVGGAAIGAGVTHILAADIRIGSESSTYGFPFLALQTMPELGASGLLARLVGFGRAVDLCLTAATIDAAEALRIGLITRIAPAGELLDQAVALAERTAGFPEMQTKLTKEMLYANVLEADANEILKRESRAFVTLIKARKASGMTDAAGQPVVPSKS